AYTLRITFATEVEGELVPMERNDGDEYKKEKRNQLGDRRDDIDEGRLLYALQDQDVNEPQANGSADDRRKIVAAAKQRNEMGKCGEDGDRICTIAQKGAQPVTPSAIESDKVAEPRFGVGIGTGIELGLPHGKVLIDESEHQHAKAGDDPADDDRSRRS